MEKVLKRSEISDNFKWKNSDLVANSQEFEKIFNEILALMDKIVGMKGKLNQKDVLLTCLKTSDEAECKLEKIYAYKFMIVDQDLNVSESNSEYQRVFGLYVKYSENTSFVTTELSSLPNEYLNSVANDPAFKDYDLAIKRIIEGREHLLGEKEEQLLAGLGEIFDSFSNIFNMSTDADMVFPSIKDENGNDVQLSHSKYGLLLASSNREVRKNAYETYYKEFGKNINHISATYSSSVKKDCFLAKTRKFSSALECALFYEEVSKEVYERLLLNISKTCPKVHEYIALRKKALNLPDIRFYDLYTSMVESKDLKLKYEDAIELVKTALKPLGQEYAELLNKAFTEGWIDIYNNEGKRSGAYSLGTYDCHPFVLLNYEETSHDVFTIAHELGHAMHSYFSSKFQPYAKHDYKIFVAEVASTVNEVLLLRNLIDNAKDKETKKFYLNYFLDMFRTTIFRQTMFAEFESVAHSKEESGIPLTKDLMNEEYEKLNKKYYGTEIIHDEFIKTEWCRIPHFYRTFYVYKYATGLISAISIAYGILENGQKNVDSYMKFLQSGASDIPTNLLKIAGVDLTTDAPFEKAMNIFASTLDELKSMY
ncbi:MAG: oligoendopeptidase F [Clostridia bacterium]